MGSQDIGVARAELPIGSVGRYHAGGVVRGSTGSIGRCRAAGLGNRGKAASVGAGALPFILPNLRRGARGQRGARRVQSCYARVYDLPQQVPVASVVCWGTGGAAGTCSGIAGAGAIAVASSRVGGSGTTRTA